MLCITYQQLLMYYAGVCSMHQPLYSRSQYCIDHHTEHGMQVVVAGREPINTSTQQVGSSITALLTSGYEPSVPQAPYHQPKAWG
jgi:hypothetical protein